MTENTRQVQKALEECSKFNTSPHYWAKLEILPMRNDRPYRIVRMYVGKKVGGRRWTAHLVRDYRVNRHNNTVFSHDSYLP